MTPFYDYVAKQLVGKKVHFKCNCIVGLDVTGVCVSYEIAKTEIVFIIDTKLSVEPPTNSANTLAASLAECTNKSSNNCSIVSRSPI